MKRDLDLIRLLLLEIEKSDDPPVWFPYPPDSDVFKGYSEESVLYNLSLLKDAGFINANISYGDDRIMGVIVGKITWNGHEFIDMARSEKLWTQAKDITKNTIGTLTLEALKFALTEITKKLLTGG